MNIQASLKSWLNTYLTILSFTLLLLGATTRIQAQIFVAEPGLHVISEYSLDGTPVNESLVTGLSGPEDLAISGDDLYETDYNSSGAFVGEYTTSGAVVNSRLISGSSYYQGLAISGGILYLATDLSIQTYSLSGTPINLSFINTPHLINGIAVSGTDLFVLTVDETYVPELAEYNATTGALLNASLIYNLADPVSLAVSGSSIYICDYAGGIVLRYSTNGSFVESAGEGGDSNAAGVAVLGDNLYVTEVETNAVGEFKANSGATVSGTFLSLPFLAQPEGIVVVPETSPVINSALSATGTAGSAFDYKITATNYPTSFEATGLPPGLSVDASIGLISGTPTANGKFAVTISAGNARGTGSARLDLVVDFSGVKGSFEGSAALAGTDAGLFTLSVTPTGSFTGKLMLAGADYSLKGTLSASGTFSGAVKSGAVTLDVTLSVDSSSTPAVSGAITAITASGSNSYTVEGSLLGTYKASTLPSGLAGGYTVVIPALSGTDPTLPAGPGYGTMTVAKTGAVHIAGKLGDGTSFSVGGQLNADGQTWTLFELLYPGKHPGSIEGTMTFENLENSDCDGTLQWIKPAQTTGYYPGGFSTSVDLMAAKYVAPPLPLTSGTITVGGGNLPASAISDTLTISTKNKVIVSGTSDVSVTLTPGAGTFSGRFLYPGGDKKTSFDGVIYQKPLPAAGYGLFMGTDESGGVEITQ